MGGWARNIPIEIPITQAAHETGFGKVMPGNNVLGITSESGKLKRYRNIKDCFKDYFNFIVSYKGIKILVEKGETNPKMYFSLLRKYADDDLYTRRLKDVYKYNKVLIKEALLEISLVRTDLMKELLLSSWPEKTQETYRLH